MPEYERLQRLGAGNFGEVWLVYDKALDVRRAVKYVRPDRIHNPTDFYREPRALMELRHEHVVRVWDAGKEEDGTLYIAMEHLPRGSLETRFRGRPLHLSYARRLLCGVCWGLEYAHNKGYVHRDIKPANILLGRNGQAKLSDFGLAARVPRGETASPYGYLTHLPPEVLRDGVFTARSDLYALGVTAYRLINGDAFLPNVTDFGELQDLVIAGEYPDRSHYRPYVPSRLKRIVNASMHPDTSRRTASASTLRRQLEGVSIFCNWKWQPERARVVYGTKIDHSEVEVIVARRNKHRFDLETSKRGPSGLKRRVTKDCAYDLPLGKMKSRLRKILSRYVLEGK